MKRFKLIILKFLASCTEDHAIMYEAARKGDFVAAAALLWGYTAWAFIMYTVYVGYRVLSL